jgi:hypothetical protein
MTRVGLIPLLAALAAGCAASDAEVREAKISGYRTDYAIVYSETLAAVRELYPHVNENAAAGTIKTGWHPIKIRTGAGDNDGTAATPVQDPTVVQPGSGAFAQGTLGRKQYFVRFDVAVVGGKPWRVRVQGRASSWDIAGGVPSELRGAEVPSWLEGRTNALQIAIHKRLKKHAVRLKFRDEKPAEAKVDVARFGNVPNPAAKLVSTVHRAATARDATALRATMVDDFVWSAGSDPDADVAVAMWHADATILAELARVLDAGCRVDDSQTLVTCPPTYTEEPGYRGYRAGFKLVDGRWKLAFFTTGE